jgi:curved DNA-binding protein
MKFIDYYKVMGVAEDASADDIKKAYRRLARKYHPDVSKERNAEAKFKELGEAYEVLKDPDKRAEYDNLRKYGAFHGEEFTPPPGWRSRADFGGGGFTEADIRHFSDFFESIFGGGPRGGGGRGPRFAMRGEDAHYRLAITLEDAYAGATRAISLPTHRFDDRGRALADTRTLQVKIPKGVTHGQRIRLKGQGNPGAGGAPDGDLYLQVEIAPHQRFVLDRRDVTLVLPITPWEAALGASVHVPTLGGTVKLTIPPGSQSGQKFRLKGRGLPGKPPGDEFVVLQIVVPEPRTERDREVFRQMQKQMDFDPRARLEQGS